MPAKQAIRAVYMKQLSLTSLYSGSTGNCLLIECASTKILVDCGVTMKKAVAGLSSLGISPNEVSALLVTHEHSDHIHGVGYLAKYFGVPVYSTPKTGLSVSLASQTLFEPGKAFEIGDIQIAPFSTSHDAKDPVGFTFTDGVHSIGLIADTGAVTKEAYEALCGVDAAYVEANHDIAMLNSGPYPYHLKKRILSPGGHLSNDDAAYFIAELIRNGLTRAMLGHLSLENNTPMAAFDTVEAYAAEQGMKRRIDYILGVAPHYEPSSPLSPA
ncbi:MAG: MBL fold metallo-hydrolase [Eubacteriaceae bacterium]|jgi:phosphoribosyl 1,2-cyclic phosphodiesterase|nr:MBL fold metallo-hydrolase [Eubacteriaceae bacterium]